MIQRADTQLGIEAFCKIELDRVKFERACIIDLLYENEVVHNHDLGREVSHHYHPYSPKGIVSQPFVISQEFHCQFAVAGPRPMTTLAANDNLHFRPAYPRTLAVENALNDFHSGFGSIQRHFCNEDHSDLFRSAPIVRALQFTSSKHVY